MKRKDQQKWYGLGVALVLVLLLYQYSQPQSVIKKDDTYAWPSYIEPTLTGSAPSCRATMVWYEAIDVDTGELIFGPMWWTYEAADAGNRWSITTADGTPRNFQIVNIRYNFVAGDAREGGLKPCTETELEALTTDVEPKMYCRVINRVNYIDLGGDTYLCTDPVILTPERQTMDTGTQTDVGEEPEGTVTIKDRKTEPLVDDVPTGGGSSDDAGLIEEWYNKLTNSVPVGDQVETEEDGFLVKYWWLIGLCVFFLFMFMSVGKGGSQQRGVVYVRR